MQSSPSGAVAAKCGFWRWPVKTLSDGLVSKVSYQPLHRKVAYLRSLQTPGDVFTWGPFHPRAKGVERRTYRINVIVRKAVIEDDHDIHLVVSGVSAKNKTMIVEFADPNCQGAAASSHRKAMRAARNSLLAACPHIGTSFVDVKGKATITGVGFWDDVHGQTGVAPNGLELHPVLGFSGACSAASSGGGSGGGGGGGGSKCDSSYPTVCIAPPPPDLDCPDVPYTNFKVVPPDDQRFDGDGDGFGCET